MTYQFMQEIVDLYRTCNKFEKFVLPYEAKNPLDDSEKYISRRVRYLAFRGAIELLLTLNQRPWLKEHRLCNTDDFKLLQQIQSIFHEIPRRDLYFHFYQLLQDATVYEFEDRNEFLLILNLALAEPNPTRAIKKASILIRLRGLYQYPMSEIIAIAQKIDTMHHDRLEQIHKLIVQIDPHTTPHLALPSSLVRDVLECKDLSTLERVYQCFLNNDRFSRGASQEMGRMKYEIMHNRNHSSDLTRLWQSVFRALLKMPNFNLSHDTIIDGLYDSAELYTYHDPNKTLKDLLNAAIASDRTRDDLKRFASLALVIYMDQDINCKRLRELVEGLSPRFNSGQIKIIVQQNALRLLPLLTQADADALAHYYVDAYVVAKATGALNHYHELSLPSSMITEEAIIDRQVLHTSGLDRVNLPASDSSNMSHHEKQYQRDRSRLFWQSGLARIELNLPEDNHGKVMTQASRV